MSNARTRLLLLASLLVLSLAGCGYGSGPMNGTLVPSVSGLSPSSVANGSAAFTLTVTGAYFASDSVVYFNGNPLQTTPVQVAYGSTNAQVTAQVPAADVTTAGAVPVYVHTGGQNSNSVTFTIQ